MAIAAGDLTAARTAYQASLDIRTRGWPPPTPPTPNGSGTCRSATNKLGDVAAAAGDLTAARTAYQTSLEIFERLVATDPTNTQWQREAEVARKKLTDVLGGTS